MRKTTAFTMVELLIASSIFLAVAVTIYSAFSAGLSGLRHINENIDTNQAGRQILERLNSDLRNCFSYSRGKESKFVGLADQMSFLTLVDTFSVDKIEQDYAFVSYQLAGQTLTRSCRKLQESLNVRTQAEAEEFSGGIEKLKFTYGYIDPLSNSLQFKDSWARMDAPDEEKAFLPVAVAVEVTLAIKGKIERKFQRTIYLPLAG